MWSHHQLWAPQLTCHVYLFPEMQCINTESSKRKSPYTLYGYCCDKKVAGRSNAETLCRFYAAASCSWTSSIMRTLIMVSCLVETSIWHLLSPSCPPKWREGRWRVFPLVFTTLAPPSSPSTMRRPEIWVKRYSLLPHWCLVPFNKWKIDHWVLCV